MSTIATLSVGLTANAAGFTSGMDGARKSADLFGSSLKSARSIYDSTRTPAERYAAQLETLQKHFDKGKIDAETYARALKSVEEGYRKLNEAAAASAAKEQQAAMAKATAARAQEAKELEASAARLRPTNARPELPREYVTAQRDAAAQAARIEETHMREARGIFDSTRTSAEKYSMELGHIREHYRAGRIDADTYGRAVKSAGEEHKKRLEGAEGKGRKGEGGFGGMAASIAEWELLQGAVEKVVHTLEGAERTERLAATVGISTQELQKLEYAARMSDTPLETVTGAIAKLGKTLGESAMGTGSRQTAAALQALHLSASELLRMDAPTQLGAIADALNQIENPALRDQYAMELLGRSGKELLPILRMGSEGLKEFGDKAVKTGFAQSAEEMEKSVKTAEAFKEAQLAAEGAVRNAVAAIGPYIQWVSKIVEAKQRETVFTLGAAAAVGGAALAYNMLSGPVTQAISLIKAFGVANSLAAGGIAAIGVAAVYSASQITASTGFFVEFGAMLNKTFGTNADWMKGYEALKLHDLGEDLATKLGHAKFEMDQAKGADNKIEATERYIAMLKEQEEQQRKMRENAEKPLKGRSRMDNALLFLSPMLAAIAEAPLGPAPADADATKEIQEARQKLERDLEEMRKHKFEAPEAADPHAKATAGIQKYIEKLREEQEALLGTADAAKAEEFARQGAPAELVEEARRRGALIDALKEQKKASEGLSNFSQRLESEAGGQTTKEAELHALIDKAEQAQAKLRASAQASLSGSNPLDIFGAMVQSGVPAAAAIAQIAQEIERAKKALQDFQAAGIAKSFQELADKVREAEAAIKGQSAAMKALDEFVRKNPAATPEQRAEYERQAENLDRLEKLKKSVEKAKRLAEEGETPIEKNAENLDALKKALDAGAIGWDEYARGVKRANEELAKAASAKQTEFGKYDRANIMLHGRAFVDPKLDKKGDPAHGMTGGTPTGSDAGTDRYGLVNAQSTEQTRLQKQMLEQLTTIAANGFGLVN